MINQILNDSSSRRKGNSYISRMILLAGTILCFATTPGTANADTIQASLYSPLPPMGMTPVVLGLTGITPPSQAPIVGPGYTITFSPGFATDEGVVQGTLPSVHAVPVAGVLNSTVPEYLTGDYGSALTTDVNASGNYLSTGLDRITVRFSTPQSSLALLWGSIDTGNSLSFNDKANYVVTGTAVQNAAKGFVGNGFQGPGGSAYVVVDTDTPFTTVTATSDVISFELAGIAAASKPFTITPEPSSLRIFSAGICALLLLFCLKPRSTEKLTL